MCKIKVPVPLIELMKTPCFRDFACKLLNVPVNSSPSDTVNLQEEQPEIILGSASLGKPENGSNPPPPFYISLTIHDQMIHKCLLDSGDSHNLTPKAVMEALGLSITKPYHDLYAFDYRTVKCLGVIKDLVVKYHQFW